MTTVTEEMVQAAREAMDQIARDREESEANTSRLRKKWGAARDEWLRLAALQKGIALDDAGYPIES